MKNLRKRIKLDMLVRRAHVLEDALRGTRRVSFDPSGSIVVSLNTSNYICL